MIEYSGFNEFVKSSMTRILNGRSVQMPSTVYHYTSFDNLQHFLNPSADLLASHCAVMNDVREIKTGFFLFTEALKKKYGDGMNVTALWKGLDEFWADPSYVPYVFSLSTENNSLPQWRAYTNSLDGGYAIQFDLAQMANAIDGNMAGGDHHGWMEFMTPCAYIGRDDVDGIVADGIERFQSVFDAYFKEGGLLQRTRAVELLIMLSSFIKDGGFAPENEWRIVVKIGNVATKFNDEVAYMRIDQLKRAVTGKEDVKVCDFRCLWNSKIYIMGGKTRVKTRLGMPDTGLAHLIKGVMLSPQGDRDKLKVVSTALLRSMGLSFAPQSVSDIPCVSR